MNDGNDDECIECGFGQITENLKCEGVINCIEGG